MLNGVGITWRGSREMYAAIMKTTPTIQCLQAFKRDQSSSAILEEEISSPLTESILNAQDYYPDNQHSSHQLLRKTQDIKTQGFQLLRNICLNNIYIQLCNARM
jgi:hypothetical protein